jgi:hypothetical protein
VRVNFVSSFWEKVDKRGPDECWEWMRYRYRSGYGRFRGVGAHRVSWEIANGRHIPDGLFVCHSCDNRACVNPAHLWLGTAADNMRDMTEKGRSRAPILREGYHSGELNPKSKLTEADVIEIRKSSLTCDKLAPIYGVSPDAIARARRGASWGHVAGAVK